MSNAAAMKGSKRSIHPQRCSWDLRSRSQARSPSSIVQERAHLISVLIPPKANRRIRPICSTTIQILRYKFYQHRSSCSKKEQRTVKMIRLVEMTMMLMIMRTTIAERKILSKFLVVMLNLARVERAVATRISIWLHWRRKIGSRHLQWIKLNQKLIWRNSAELTIYRIRGSSLKLQKHLRRLYRRIRHTALS